MDKKSIELYEVEHKYLANNEFDLQKFVKEVQKLGPTDDYEVDVLDHYFITQKVPEYIYRHRVDKKGQVLTAKSNKYLTTSDNEVREEINILLSQELGQQTSQVGAFMQTLGSQWSGCIVKKVRVFNFEKCEVCYYEARRKPDNQAATKLFRCIEFEAKNFKTVEEALQNLTDFEKKLGFSEINREKSSIFELVFSNELESVFEKPAI